MKTAKVSSKPTAGTARAYLHPQMAGTFSRLPGSTLSHNVLVTGIIAG